MSNEELLRTLDREGVVVDGGEWVELSESFHDVLDTYRQFVTSRTPDSLVAFVIEQFDDLPDTETVRENLRECEADVIARYLAIRAETDLDDSTAMNGAVIIESLVDSP